MEYMETMEDMEYMEDMQFTEIDREQFTKEELFDIDQYLEYADSWGLESEVVWSAKQFLSTGSGIDEAFTKAFWEWDI